MQVFLALSKRILSLILLDLESKLSLLYTYFGGPYGSVPVDKKGIFIPSKKKEKKRKVFLKWKQKKVDFGPNQIRNGYASKRKDDDQESGSRNGEAQPKLSLQ